MNYNEALETMCKRCTNYEVCQGTGCGPKKTLAEFPYRVIGILEENMESCQKGAAFYKAKDNDLHDPFKAGEYETEAQAMKRAVKVVKEVLNAR